jgi:hypothetical protein
MIASLRPGGAGGWGSPAKRFARAFEGVAVRPHQKAATALTIAMAPKMTVMFMVQLLVGIADVTTRWR